MLIFLLLFSDLLNNVADSEFPCVTPELPQFFLDLRNYSFYIDSYVSKIFDTVGNIGKRTINNNHRKILIRINMQ